MSSCLLGQRVRYDGEIKTYTDMVALLQQYFVLHAVCPEVEIGLSVPRPALQLTANALQPRMTGRDQPALDVTIAMRAFCEHKPAQLSHICGYVFKSKSPSCGLKNIPVFVNGNIIADNNRGLFSQAILERWPELPVREETELQTVSQRDQFIAQVMDYFRQHQVSPSL